MWKIKDSNVVLHTPIFDVVETEKINPKGNTFKGISLNTPNWVSAIVYNKDTNKFIMVNEFRHGINKYILEFPSGTVEENETSEHAIIREIKEETGYTPNVIRTLFIGNPNTAFMNNIMTCYYVEVSGKPDKQSLDENEDIDIVEITLNEMKEAITEESSISQQLALTKFLNNKEN